MTPLSQHIVSIVTGSILIVGTTICYIPQIVELLLANTTRGVSFWTYFLSSLAYWLNFVSLFISDYWTLFTNDPTVPFGNNLWIRLDAWFAVVNLFSQFVMPLFVLITIVVVRLRETDRDWLEKKRVKDLSREKEDGEGVGELEADSTVYREEESPPDTSEGQSTTLVVAEEGMINAGTQRLVPADGSEKELLKQVPTVTRRDLVDRYVVSWVFLALMAFLALTWTMALFVSQFRWPYRSKIVDVFPILASVLFFGLWLPQIFLTACVVRGKGSMNLVTLFLTFVGAFVAGTYMGVAGTKWVNWLPYLFLALQQGIVFVLIVIFESVKCCRTKCGRRATLLGDEDAGDRAHDDPDSESREDGRGY